MQYVWQQDIKLLFPLFIFIMSNFVLFSGTGKRLAAKLSAAGIDTTYVLLAAVSQVLSGVTKVNTLFYTVLSKFTLSNSINVHTVVFRVFFIYIPRYNIF